MAAQQNIWVAASDGDLARVQDLVCNHAVSPNAPDENTYTPMHAAASYGHIPVLEWLISQGGDVNITDEDGDTPLYTVEDTATARCLVEHGAALDMRNAAGVSPLEHLDEEAPDVAAYLRSSSSSPSQNILSETLTTNLMQSVQDAMQRADAEGWDADEELRRIVGRTVLEGVASGCEIAHQSDDEKGGGGEAE